VNLPARKQRSSWQQDQGDDSDPGTGRLAGKAAVITGADSGIARALAIAYASEGADVLIAYAGEHEDAQETAARVERAGRKALLVPGDLASAAHCHSVIDAAVLEFGRVDVLVSNAAPPQAIEDVSGQGRDQAVATNLSAFCHLTKAALPHMRPGSAIIGTALGRPGQPAEVLPAYFLLARDEASYISGAQVAVTGGQPIL
jgi:NAD(P)-dependent dehydrogenase (short-subunit alcohol dehydrogenase family)